MQAPSAKPVTAKAYLAGKAPAVGASLNEVNRERGAEQAPRASPSPRTVFRRGGSLGAGKGPPAALAAPPRRPPPAYRPGGWPRLEG
jgi:hypothetical protein